MQSDAKKILINSVKRAVFLLLLLSSLAGLAWGAVNFFYLQQFSETTTLIRLARTLKSSGETGILYPAFLLIVITLVLDMPIRFYIPLFIAQLVLAFVSWYVFASTVTKGSKASRALFSFLVITNPFALQCHLAILEYSFASSFLCLLISFCLRFSSEWKKIKENPGEAPALDKAMTDISVTSLFWLLLSMTRREFVFIGAIPVIALVVTITKAFVGRESADRGAKRKTGNGGAGRGVAIAGGLKRSAPHLVLAVAFASIVIIIDSLFATGEKIPVADSVKRSLFYRVASTSYFYDANSTPDELSDIVSDQALYLAKNDPGSIRDVYTKEAAENIGSDAVTELYTDFFVYAFSGNKKALVKETILDLVGYIFPPARTEYVLEGNDLPGFVTGNYELMARTVKTLTKYYLRLFSILMFFILLIAAAIAFADKKHRGTLKIYMMPLTVMVISAVFYTSLGVNVWDHRKALFATCMLVAFVLRETAYDI